VGSWLLVAGEIARKSGRKFMKAGMLPVRVAQVAYFCVWWWIFSGWSAGWLLVNMLMEE
jgi:hypothetical protein